jgi:hypothetical protein
VSRFFSLIHKLKHEQKPIVQRFDVDHHHHHKSLSAVAEGLDLKSSSIIRKLNQEEPNHPTSDFLVPFDHRGEF